MSRELIFIEKLVIVPLTQGYFATIDIGDVDVLQGRSWSALISPRRKAVYACRVEHRKMLLLHREVMGAEAGPEVDHRDGDGLNCRRLNLRNCTRGQNVCNSPARKDNRSGLKGAIWDSRSSKWRAEISRHGKRAYLGLFPSAELAHAAYCDAAAREYGEFARQS